MRDLEQQAASPPTRGWTLAALRAGGVRRGFPAHAGMDPVHEVRAAGGEGLPRPRGDGPAEVMPVAGTLEASPPTRGWTRGEIGELGAHSGEVEHGFRRT